MALSESSKVTLKKNRIFLLDNLADEHIVDHLVTEGVLDTKDEETIEGEKTRGKKIKALLKIINLKSQREFDIFMSVLERQQRHVFDTLNKGIDETDVGTPVEETSFSRQESHQEPLTSACQDTFDPCENTSFSCQDSNHESLKNEETRLVAIGHTGDGKSSTINSILKEKVMTVKRGPCSGTKLSDFARRSIDGRDIVCTDTPGIFDTDIPNDDTMREVLKCMGLSAPGPHAFLLAISMQRMTEEKIISIKLLKETFGEDMLKFTIIVFTRRDEYDDDGEDPENYIKDIRQSSSPAMKFIADLLQSCHSYVFFNNKLPPKSEGNQKQVRQLLTEIDRLQQIKNGSFYTSPQFQSVEQVLLTEEESRLKKEIHEVCLSKELTELMSKCSAQDEGKANEEKKLLIKANMTCKKKESKKRRKIRDEMRQELITVTESDKNLGFFINIGIQWYSVLKQTVADSKSSLLNLASSWISRLASMSRTESPKS